MSIESVYADSINATIRRWAANPGPLADPGFSLTSFFGAGLKGIPAAVLEMSGSAADATSGFGNVLAATGGSAGGMFATPDPGEQLQEAAARKRMLEGDNQDVAIGNVLRRKAETFSPDPLTAHRADQVVFGIVNFGAKAAAAVGTGGLPGAAVLGVEEANTETQRLREDGIDTATATKVGAVQGVASAAGAVLPLGGKTILQTLGLVATGGPGMYMVQEATARALLERAGYADEASLHNPFDPLGLGLSVIVPGAFGALHMRNLPAAPKLVDVVKHIESGGNPNAVGPNIPGQGTAKGEMQVMDATNADPGFGVTPAKDNSPEERARVGREYLGAMVTRYGEQDKALAAYNAGPGTVDKAMAAHGDNWLAHMPEETQKYVAKARKLTGDYVASEGAKNPEVVDAARVSVLNDTMQRNLPDAPDAYARVMRAADIVGESGGRAAEAETAPVHPTAMPDFKAWFADSKAVDEQGAPLTVYHGTKSDFERFDPAAGATPGSWFTTDRTAAGEFGNVREATLRIQNPATLEELATARREVAAKGAVSIESDPVAFNRAVIANMEAKGFDGIHDANFNGAGGAGREVWAAFRPEQIKEAPQQTGAPLPARESNNALPATDSIRVAGDQPATRGAEVGSTESLGKPAPGNEGGAKAADSGSTLDQTVAKKIAAEQPDLLVTLPGTEERITVAEALKRIAEEQKQDGHWADLVKVAAECALTAG